MSYEAEQNVIGALLMDFRSIEKIHGILEPEMFTCEMLGRMYLELLRGYENNWSVDALVLSSCLRDEGYPQQEIGEEIKRCISSTVTSANIKSHADLILREHKARILNKILQGFKTNPSTINEQIGELLTSLEELIENRSAESKTLPEIARQYKDKYFQDNESEKMYLGFSKIDELLGGLEGGDVIVIGARPAVGKSALVTQITANLAKRGKRVGFYNLEMQDKQIYERFVASYSGISLNRLRRAVRFLGDEETRFRMANEAIERQNNIIITTGSKSASEIKAESLHMMYDIIIIDYLQLLRTDKTYKGNRYAEVGAISKAIKALAMELNIPIIALSQLNRVSEMKETKEPTMAELREAGDIEQDASIILLMWNISQNDRRKKGLKVEKQRQGNTGKVVLDFDGELMKFTELNETVESAREWVKQEDDECPFQ